MIEIYYCEFFEWKTYSYLCVQFNNGIAIARWRIKRLNTINDTRKYFGFPPLESVLNP